jgi:lysozyme family protein
MTDRFEACLAHVLQHEGGYVDHPTDPGGATNMGITRKTLAQWRKVSPWTALPKTEVRRLTRAEASRIYLANYWSPVGAERMPAGLDLALFDYAVNSGPNRAIRDLQSVLGVVVDGVAGPKTLAAANADDRAATVGALCDRRLAFLQGLTTFPTFGRGWTSRVEAVRRQGLADAAITITRGEKTMDVLSGHKTYIVAAMMLLAGIAQILGVELPSMEGSAAGNLILEALAVIFLRQGIKGIAGKA